MILNDNDKVYCYNSTFPFIKGKTYTIFHIKIGYIMLTSDDNDYIRRINSELFENHFTSMKEIRKNKLEKLNKYET